MPVSGDPLVVVMLFGNCATADAPCEGPDMKIEMQLTKAKILHLLR
jgi:hypothetical protein